MWESCGNDLWGCQCESGWDILRSFCWSFETFKDRSRQWRGKLLTFAFRISDVPGVWWLLPRLWEGWVGDFTVVIAGEGLERSTRASDSAPAVGFMWALSYAVHYAAFLSSFKRWLNDDQGVFSHVVESKTNKVELTYLKFPVDFMENEERITLYNYALFFFLLEVFFSDLLSYNWQIKIVQYLKYTTWWFDTHIICERISPIELINMSVTFYVFTLLVKTLLFYFLLFSYSVVSDSLRPHGLQHTRLPCPSPSPGACSNPCPLSRWCHPTISSSIVPFSSCPQSFPASGSFLMSWLFASGGHSFTFLADFNDTIKCYQLESPCYILDPQTLLI